MTDICICIENSDPSKRKDKKKLDKKSVVMAIYNELFSDVDLSVIDGIIQHAFDNRLLKKYGNYKVLKLWISRFFLSKSVKYISFSIVNNVVQNIFIKYSGISQLSYIKASYLFTKLLSLFKLKYCSVCMIVLIL